MFKWLRGAAQGENRAKVNRALSTVGVEVPLGLDDIQYCIKAAAAVVRIIAAKAGTSIQEMDDDSKYVAGIFSFVASDYLAGIFGESFEMISCVVPLDLFGVDFAGVVSLGNSYNRISQSGEIIQAIGQNLANWIAIPTDAQLQRLADLFKLCRQHIV